jgi:hypothetical protein
LPAGLIGVAPLAAWPIRTCRSPVVAPFGKETTADLIAAIVSETMSGVIGRKAVVERKPRMQRSSPG